MTINGVQIPTFRESFDQMVERCIEMQEIYPDLYRLCRATGEDYNDVVSHINNEIDLNGGVR